MGDNELKKMYLTDNSNSSIQRIMFQLAFYSMRSLIKITYQGHCHYQEKKRNKANHTKSSSQFHHSLVLLGLLPTLHLVVHRPVNERSMVQSKNKLRRKKGPSLHILGRNNVLEDHIHLNIKLVLKRE